MASWSRQTRLIAGTFAGTFVLAGLLIATVTQSELIVSYTTTVGGIGSAVATIAAWRAANQSDKTAQRATESLGLALRPEIRADVEWMQTNAIGGIDSTRARLKVRNTSPWSASNVVVTYDNGRGWRTVQQVGRVEGARPSPIGAEPIQGEIAIEMPDAVHQPMPWADPAWQGSTEITSTTVVEYEDERGLLRWRRTSTYKSTGTRRADGFFSGGSGGDSLLLERVW